MDIELPLHRIILFPDCEVKLPRNDATMDVLPTLFFVEEAINHFLETQLLIFHWPMPVDLQLLREKIPDKSFFDRVIGKAISHNCAAFFSLNTAQKYGFTVEFWSELEGNLFRTYTQYYLEIVRIKSKPANLSLIHMISFALVLSCTAVQIGSVKMMHNLIWSVVHKLGERFPYEWIYESLHHWALTYNFRHNDLDETWGLEDNIEEGGIDEVVDHLVICWRS